MTIATRLIDTIFSLSRCLREKTQSNSEIAQLSMVQLQTLVFLAKETSSPMKHIADYLRIELPSTTSLIDNLVGMNFVIRKQDKKDKRVIQISLTGKGKKLLQKAKKEKAERLERFFVTLSNEEKHQLLAIFQKLQKAMEISYEK